MRRSLFNSKVVANRAFVMKHKFRVRFLVRPKYL